MSVHGISYYTLIGIDRGISRNLGPAPLVQRAFCFKHKIAAGRGPTEADLTGLGLDVQCVRDVPDRHVHRRFATRSRKVSADEQLVTDGGQIANSTTQLSSYSLQKALASDPGDRIAAAWSAPDRFSIEVALTDSLTHQVGLYFLDWDENNQRVQQSQQSLLVHYVMKGCS